VPPIQSVALDASGLDAEPSREARISPCALPSALAVDKLPAWVMNHSPRSTEPVGVRNSDHPCDLRLRPELAAGQRRANRALSRARAGQLAANRIWMKSQSDALRSSPGAPHGLAPKATEGRMFASVAPEVLARLRHGVAKPQVKPLIGVSDPYRACAGSGRAKSEDCGSGTSIFRSVVSASLRPFTGIARDDTSVRRRRPRRGEPSRSRARYRRNSRSS
jgi:hypothetical protein